MPDGGVGGEFIDAITIVQVTKFKNVLSIENTGVTTTITLNRFETGIGCMEIFCKFHGQAVRMHDDKMVFSQVMAMFLKSFQQFMSWCEVAGCRENFV